MSRRLEKMKRKIERAGGIVYLRDDLPNQIAEAFLDEVLACPDCAAAMATWNHDTLTRTSGFVPDGPTKREDD